MGSGSRLEDFGIGDTPEERVRAHQMRCRSLPRDAQAAYWRGVYKADPELFRFMNGCSHREAQRRLRVVKRR